MPTANKHRSNSLYGTALDYMTTVLGLWKKCHKPACTGTMTPVLVRYKDHGPINSEHECSSCGKVLKDPRFRKQRQSRWKNKQRQGKNKKYQGGKKNDSRQR